MTRKYTKTQKRIDRDIRQTDWERRIYILTRKNQGWSLYKIAKELGLTTQAVNKVWKKMSGKTIQELEELQRKAESENI